jgi:hypothetical protein
MTARIVVLMGVLTGYGVSGIALAVELLLFAHYMGV